MRCKLRFLITIVELDMMSDLRQGHKSQPIKGIRRQHLANHSSAPTKLLLFVAQCPFGMSTIEGHYFKSTHLAYQMTAVSWEKFYPLGTFATCNQPLHLEIPSDYEGITDTMAEAASVQRNISNNNEEVPSDNNALIQRRKKNAAKEKNRLQQLQTAFSNLQNHIPYVPQSGSIPRIKTLRLAIAYIHYLEKIISSPPSIHLESSEFRQYVEEELRRRYFHTEKGGYDVNSCHPPSE